MISYSVDDEGSEVMSLNFNRLLEYLQVYASV